jgi:hypothetical protein
VSESVHQTPQVVISDEEIFEAHVAGKLSVELKVPLDTQRGVVGDDLAPEFIVPSPLDPRVGPAVAAAVAAAAAEI